MSRFDFIKESTVTNSFKVQKIKGMYDLPQSTTVIEHFSGELTLPTQWKLGLIVGNSGTGKTTLAHTLFPEESFQVLEYSDTDALVDSISPSASVDEITKMLVNVGLSSVPTWLKPYQVLSNGEKMRADLARVLLSDATLSVFDEFTSVVDRDVAKVVSMVVNKAVNASDKQFVAVSCHEDIIEWLQPDWIFDTNTMSMRDSVKKNDQTSQSTSDGELMQSGAYLASITI